VCSLRTSTFLFLTFWKGRVCENFLIQEYIWYSHVKHSHSNRSVRIGQLRCTKCRPLNLNLQSLYALKLPWSTHAPEVIALIYECLGKLTAVKWQSTENMTNSIIIDMYTGIFTLIFSLRCIKAMFKAPPLPPSAEIPSV